MRFEQIAWSASGGVTLRADAAGDVDAPPVLLLHGGGQTRHSWHNTAAALASQGWRAYSVDLRGHGESDWAPDGNYGGSYAIGAFVADLAAVAAQLSVPPVFIGASLGGISSLITVGEGHAAARALVLVDIAAKIEPAGSQRVKDFMLAHAEDGFGSLEEVAETIAAYNPHRPRSADLSGLRKNVRQRPDGRWVWHWDPRFMVGPFDEYDEARVAHAGEARLERAARALRVPTLLVRGRLSDLLSEEGARDFLRLAPHAEHADVAAAGHMIAGDRNDAFNDAVLAFLSRLR